MMSKRSKKNLGEKINSLGGTEHMEIFKILKTHNISFSENKNGVFFNLTTLPDDVLAAIETFVSYCYENKEQLDEYDKRLNECKYRNNINNMVRVPTYQTSINEPLEKNVRWKELVESVDKENNLRDFIVKLSNHTEKVMNKRSATKFTMAKKKFIKRNAPDSELKDELEMDE
jgi:Bromodomain extra-terminal - transcription regulation